MYRVDFLSIGAGKGLQFAWDPAAGVLSGRDAAFVLLAVQDALRDGTVTSHPWPTVYQVRDPLHSLPELAAVVSQFCVLNEEWQSALGRITPLDDDIDSGDMPVIS